MALYQLVTLAPSTTYQISYRITAVGGVSVQVAEDYERTVMDQTNLLVEDTFTHDFGSGDYTMSFNELEGASSITVDTVSLRPLTQGTADNRTVNEFLTGNTDNGREIFFRADTQVLQIQPSPELYSSPLGVAVEMERGTQTKTFISLDDKPFYQLEGTNVKGVSILKPNARSDEEVKPPLAQSIQISLRDSSKQLNRIIQLAVVTLPTPIDYSP